MMRKCFFLALVLTLCACGHKSADSASATTKSMEAASQAIERGDTAYAIDIYRQVIATIADSSAYASMAPMVVEAMDRLANVESKSGNVGNAIQWMEELRRHPTSLVRATAWRDLHTCLAMLYMQAGNVEQAEEYMSAALELPIIGGDSDHRYYRDYVQASRIFIGNDERRAEIPGWLERALKHAESCDCLNDLSYARSMLGTLYFWQGRIGDAFAIMNENLKEVEASGDTIGTIMALNTLTNLHNVYHLYEISNRYASRAIALAEAANLANSVTISDAYMLKIGAISNLRSDSVKYYVAKAERNCSNRPYNMGQEDIDFAAANHILFQELDDSTLSASEKNQMRDEAEMRLWRYVRNVAPIKRAGAFCLLSRLYIDDNPARGESMLDSMYCYQHLVEGIPMTTKENTLFAIKHYAKTGNTPKLMRYVHDLIENRTMENDNSTEQQLVENIIELRTAQAEAQVEQLQLEMQLRQSRTMVAIAVSVAALLLLIVLFMAYRRRQAVKLQTVNREKSSLEQQLTTEVEKTNETRRELDEIVNDLDSRRAIELLTPDLLKQKGETEFYKRFHLLYPNFSKNMEAMGIALGRREEIMCMLIVLGHDNQDIASILNIERKSVNVARYRLRQKLKLAEETNLDLFLKTAATAEAEK